AVLSLDGGLPLPASESARPGDLAQGSLAPALARFALRFASVEEYVAWWQRHPAFACGQVESGVLAAYAAHDLAGVAPELRPSVSEDAIRADALELATAGTAA